MPNREDSVYRVVYLTEEGVMGVMTGPMGAYFTDVWYIKNGIEYILAVENEDFILLEDLVDNDED